MIGREFQRAKRVVVLLIDEDDRQHGFEVYPSPGSTVRWTWTGTTTKSPIGPGSVAELTVTGRFHRRDRPGDLEAPPTPALES